MLVELLKGCLPWMNYRDPKDVHTSQLEVRRPGVRLLEFLGGDRRRKRKKGSCRTAEGVPGHDEDRRPSRLLRRSSLRRALRPHVQRHLPLRQRLSLLEELKECRSSRTIGRRSRPPPLLPLPPPPRPRSLRPKPESLSINDFPLLFSMKSCEVKCDKGNDRIGQKL